MIEKLRKKFIRITALALFALILCVLVAVNGVFIYQNRRTINDNLDSLLSGRFDRGFREGLLPPELPEELSGTEPWEGFAENGGKGGRGAFVRPEDTDGEERTNVAYALYGAFGGKLSREFNGAVIFLDEDGSVVRIVQAIDGFYEEDMLRDLSAEIWERGKEAGRSGYYSYKRAEAKEQGASVKIAVVNASNELYSMITMLLISVVTGLVSFAVVLFVIIKASGRAIRPVAESYEKQKQFITDAGHELKTPLTVISTNNDIAKLSFGESELFDTIERQVGRMNVLVKNLITLSKMDEEQKPEFARFNLSDAVYDTVSSFLHVAEAKGKKLKLTVPDEIYLNGDEQKIRQLAAILTDNAVKYCDEGGQIDVVLSSSNRIHLIVENDYDKVSEIRLDRLFERFYRSDEARSHDGSYGLGLPIARSVTHLHGGELTVKAQGNDRIRFDAAFKRN